MNRYTLTVATAACFGGAYQLYAFWIDALTEVEAAPAAAAVQRDAPAPSSIFETTADEVRAQLPGEDWLDHARIKYQRADEVLLYSDLARPLEGSGGHRVQLTPLVIVWRDPHAPDRPPYVIKCQSARLQFEHPFGLELGAAGPSNPGRVVAAAFDGAVVIRGPDGLLVEGQDFQFAENFDELSPYLYSDQRVVFRCGPRAGEIGAVAGQADGVQFDLLPDLESEKRDMPRIAGIERIRLRRNVRLELTYEDRPLRPDGAGEPIPDDTPPRVGHATVTCDGSLEYLVADRIATLEDNVLLDRPTGDDPARPQADRLHCDVLALQFAEEPEPAESTPLAEPPSAVDGVVPASAAGARPADDRVNPLPRLRFERMQAQGNRASLQSDAQQLLANMETMHYDAATREVQLLDREMVRVQRGALNLRTPEIRLRHSDQGDLESLDCRGAGQLEQRDPQSGEPRLRAFWRDQLHVGPDPATGLTLIRADGEARLVQPDQNQIVADRLSLWADADAAQRLAAEAPAPTGQPRATESLSLRYVLAEGNVRMASREFHLETDRLRCRIDPGLLPHGPTAGRREPSAAAIPAGGVQPRPVAPPDDADEVPWVAQARDIQVRLLQAPDPRNPRKTRTDVAEATCDGDALLFQPARPPEAAGQEPDPPTEISGTRLHLRNAGGRHQTVTLTGGPAQFRRGQQRLEGQELVLDRAANTIQVPGRGFLQFPVPEKFRQQLVQPAQPLGASAGPRSESPQPGEEERRPARGSAGTVLVDVHWQEGMTFDGERARFLRNVALAMDDSRMYCEELIVTMDRPLAFTGADAASRQPEVRHIACHDGVRLEVYSWQGSQLVGIRKVELARFSLDAVSGEFEGDGRGTINDWTRGASRRVAITPESTAQANQPADSQRLEWEYTNVVFSRKLTGNIDPRQRVAQLHGRVRVTYAPVERALETFTRDEFSSDAPNAADAVWLGCETLSMSLQPWPDREGYYAQFGARGQCEMEGKLFDVSSDMVSYDESQKLFTLKGEGAREAIIYYRDRATAEPRPLPGQVIQFIPSANYVRVQGSSGFSGSQ